MTDLQEHSESRLNDILDRIAELHSDTVDLYRAAFPVLAGWNSTATEQAVVEWIGDVRDSLDLTARVCDRVRRERTATPRSRR